MLTQREEELVIEAGIQQAKWEQGRYNYPDPFPPDSMRVYHTLEGEIDEETIASNFSRILKLWQSAYFDEFEGVIR